MDAACRRPRLTCRTGSATNEIAINRYVIEKGLDTQLILYWYQSHGRVIASEYWSRLFLIRDAIRLEPHGRIDRPRHRAVFDRTSRMPRRSPSRRRPSSSKRCFRCCPLTCLLERNPWLAIQAKRIDWLSWSSVFAAAGTACRKASPDESFKRGIGVFR